MYAGSLCQSEVISVARAVTVCESWDAPATKKHDCAPRKKGPTGFDNGHTHRLDDDVLLEHGQAVAVPKMLPLGHIRIATIP